MFLDQLDAFVDSYISALGAQYPYILLLTYLLLSMSLLLTRDHLKFTWMNCCESVTCCTSRVDMMTSRLCSLIIISFTKLKALLMSDVTAIRPPSSKHSSHDYHPLGPVDSSWAAACSCVGPTCCWVATCSSSCVSRHRLIAVLLITSLLLFLAYSPFSILIGGCGGGSIGLVTSSHHDGQATSSSRPPTDHLSFHALNVSVTREHHLLLHLSDRDGRWRLVGLIGQHLQRALSDKERFVIERRNASQVFVRFVDGLTELTITRSTDNRSVAEAENKRYNTMGSSRSSSSSSTGRSAADCYQLRWVVRRGAGDCLMQGQHQYLRDEFFMKDAHWYGGAPIYEPLWPVERWDRPLEPFVTGDSYRDRYGGVQERYWLASNGASIFVDYDVPLFVAINSGDNGRLQLVSKYVNCSLDSLSSA